MMLEFSDHFVSMLCLYVVVRVLGRSKFLNEVGSEKRLYGAKKVYLELEDERTTLLLEDQDFNSREGIMAPPHFQCLNVTRQILKKGSGLRAAFSTSRISRAGTSNLFKRGAVPTKHR